MGIVVTIPTRLANSGLAISGTIEVMAIIHEKTLLSGSSYLFCVVQIGPSWLFMFVVVVVVVAVVVVVVAALLQYHVGILTAVIQELNSLLQRRVVHCFNGCFWFP